MSFYVGFMYGYVSISQPVEKNKFRLWGCWFLGLLNG